MGWDTLGALATKANSGMSDDTLWYTPCDTVGALATKANVHAQHPSNPIPGYSLREMKIHVHTNAPSSFIPGSPKPETTQLLTRTSLHYSHKGIFTQQ